MAALVAEVVGVWVVVSSSPPPGLPSPPPPPPLSWAPAASLPPSSQANQTGQYKPTEAGSTFSTAVTQGATTILIKALEDSKWFVPIERENLSNLLNERNIIRSTRKEYRKSKNPV